MNVHASLKIKMPFDLISYIYYRHSSSFYVKVYSMFLLNIHLRDGSILLSKEQKKSEQHWNMAYDCIFLSAAGKDSPVLKRLRKADLHCLPIFCS